VREQLLAKKLEDWANVNITTFFFAKGKLIQSIYLKAKE
jgi:hypothetical protein